MFDSVWALTGKRVSLIWIPDHAAIISNEMPDELTKEALEYLVRTFPLTVTMLKTFRLSYLHESSEASEIRCRNGWKTLSLGWSLPDITTSRVVLLMLMLCLRSI